MIAFLPFLTTALTWGKMNIKWIAILVLTGVLVFSAWKYTNLVEDYAQAEYKIAQQEQIIKEKEKAIQLERDISAIAIAALEQQAKDLAALDAQIEDLTKDLGISADEKAPAAILEILKRLGTLE